MKIKKTKVIYVDDGRFYTGILVEEKDHMFISIAFSGGGTGSRNPKYVYYDTPENTEISELIEKLDEEYKKQTKNYNLRKDGLLENMKRVKRWKYGY